MDARVRIKDNMSFAVRHEDMLCTWIEPRNRLFEEIPQRHLYKLNAHVLPFSAAYARVDGQYVHWDIRQIAAL